MPVGAQANPLPDRLKSLTISVWLEYDRPGGRYIFHGELSDGTTLPATLVFRVPARSGGPSSTASIDPAGGYHFVRPTLREDGDTIVVEYATNWPRFQFEYYDDVLERQGQNRQFEFSYRADHAIDQLVLEVKEPYGAAGLHLDPPASAQSQGEDGLTVHRRTVGAMAPGQEVRWKVEYNKNDARLSIEALGKPTPSVSAYEAGLSSTRAAARNRDRAVMALLALVGLVSLGGLGLSLRSAVGGQQAEGWSNDAAPKSKRSRRKQSAKGAPAPPQVRRAKYCHQCGAALLRDDLYCRRCGARRRGT